MFQQENIRMKIKKNSYFFFVFFLVIYTKEGKITKVEKGSYDVAKLHENGKVLHYALQL